MSESKPSPEAVIAQAVLQVMQSAFGVEKSGKNKNQGYDYASEADFLMAVRPAMVEAGLIALPSVTQVHRWEGETKSKSTAYFCEVHVSYTLAHVSGAVWPEKITVVGLGFDTGDKAPYKAMTGAAKYFLAKTFHLATGEDPERDVPEKDQPKSGGASSPPPAVPQEDHPSQGEAPPPSGPSGITEAQITAIWKVAGNMGIDSLTMGGRLLSRFKKAQLSELTYLEAGSLLAELQREINRERRDEKCKAQETTGR